MHPSDELLASHHVLVPSDNPFQRCAVEERDTGQGYPFTVALLNYGHPLVHKANEG